MLVEVNCETDFVARTDDFNDFAHDIAMHIAASNPTYVSVDEITDEDRANEEKLFAEELKNEGKPADMIEKIVAGKVKKWESESTLLGQPFIKNPDVTVGEYVKENIAKLGENLVISQFSRIELGGGNS